ncbi:DUF2993 domain-containing protein [Subtercola sp. PAMC28395]|uniref:LmeA family phospholipid-binding protein n=1 Tax=Subtercola sp. PAMC28395 TaxID=2846775 RepID=UPI001C0AAB84|nr:DUF2993 domain-containing protein [Subtercola sp. PAMC28395]QWT23569.1 DUF2993 domain-containing protein [Subtercola sp. PAMC28395]
MKRRNRVIAIVVAASVILGGVVVVADFGLKAFAEGQIRTAIVKNLPSNVTGDVSVQIGGGSFLAQYASGSFSEVTLNSDNLTVNGVPLKAHVVAHDVSTDQTKPIPRASGTLTLDQEAVNSFLSIPGSSEIVLADGTVGYQGSFQLFGLTLGYDATATAQPVGGTVQLTPTGATLSAGSASLDVGGALKTIVSKPISICVAQYLPKSMQVTAITPSVGSVAVDLSATDLVLTEDALKQTGSCD